MNYIQSDKILVHENGKPIFPTRPSVWFHKFLQKNNLSPITFHQLRHLNASLLIANGLDVVTLSSRLGHSDKRVTLNTYSHPITENNYEAADIMDSFISVGVKKIPSSNH